MLETAAMNLKVLIVYIFLIPSSPETIPIRGLGTSFKKEMGFNAPAWMAASYDEINRMDLDDKI